MAQGTEKTRLGKTGLEIPRLCFGTSGLGDMPDTYGYGVDEERAKATIRAILDGPANFLDTSRNYGMGRSEERIGAVIRERGGLPDGFDPLHQARPRHGNRPLRCGARAPLAGGKPRGARPRPRAHPPSPRPGTRALARRDRGPKDGAIAELFRMKEEGLCDAVGLAAGRVDIMMPMLQRLGFRRADHAQPLHARQPQRRGDDRLRARQGHRGAERRALCRRRARQGLCRLSPLRLPGGVGGDARPDPPHRGRSARGTASRPAPRRCNSRCATRASPRRSAASPGRSGCKETLEWAACPIPEAMWDELAALPASTDDPEATRDIQAGVIGKCSTWGTSDRPRTRFTFPEKSSLPNNAEQARPLERTACRAD